MSIDICDEWFVCQTSYYDLYLLELQWSLFDVGECCLGTKRIFLPQRPADNDVSLDSDP